MEQNRASDTGPGVYWVTAWAWPCFMWEHGLVTPGSQYTSAPGEESWGQMGGNTWKLWQDSVGYSWKCHREWSTCFSVSGYRWVAAGQLDSALLFTNLHIYNNWHNRHVRQQTGSASLVSPPRPDSSGDNNPELLSNNYLMVIWWLMLIRPNQQIDMANTLNTSTGRKKRLLNYSQVEWNFCGHTGWWGPLSGIRHNYSEYITLATGKTSEASHASTIKCNMCPPPEWEMRP